MKNLSATLLEQKISKLEKNLCQRSQMSQILPHSLIDDSKCVGVLEIPHRTLYFPSQCLPSQKWSNTRTMRLIFPISQINHLKSSGSGHLDGNSRQLRLSYVAWTSFSTLELGAGRHYASCYCFFSTIATLPWLSPPSQHLWLTRHVNFTFKYSIFLLLQLRPIQALQPWSDTVSIW